MRSHTVILGAGATIATIPSGDKNGKVSSVMFDLIDNLGFSNILNDIKLNTSSRNIEDIYSELSTKPEYRNVLKTIESEIYNYFSLLKIPDNPTIYDLLILSLTRKDAIATFNWDPLLIQAYVRCHRITDNLPNIYCLHGNVAVGFCIKHKEFGLKNTVCPICGDKLKPVSLLYPVKEKKYNSNDYIKLSWEATENFIENSYMLTIFGYSAPKSDIEALRLMKKAWGKPNDRMLEEVSVIDIIDESQITEKWSDFIYSHHYKYSNDFFNSYLGMFPRRTCETVFATKQFNIPPDVNSGFLENMSWDDLENYLRDILKKENETPEGKNYPLHYLKKADK